MSELRKNIVTNQKAELVGVASELIVVTAIFAAIRFCHEFFKGLGHRILFPLAGIFSLYRAIFAWRGAYLEGLKGMSTSKAWHVAMETLAALAISTAVIGGIVAEALFKTISPLIFTVLLAVKTLYNLGASLIYGFRAYLGSEEGAAKLFKANAFATFTNALSTLACGFVFVAQQVSMAFLGMAAGILTTSYAIYHAVTLPYPSEGQGGSGSGDSSNSETEEGLPLLPGHQKARDKQAKSPSPHSTANLRQRPEKNEPASQTPSSFFSINVSMSNDLDSQIKKEQERIPQVQPL